MKRKIKRQSGTFKVGTIVHFKGKEHGGGEVIDTRDQDTANEIVLVRVLHMDGASRGREIRRDWFPVRWLEEA